LLVIFIRQQILGGKLQLIERSLERLERVRHNGATGVDVSKQRSGYRCHTAGLARHSRRNAEGDPGDVVIVPSLCNTLRQGHHGLLRLLMGNQIDLWAACKHALGGTRRMWTTSNEYDTRVELFGQPGPGEAELFVDSVDCTPDNLRLPVGDLVDKSLCILAD